MYGLTDGLKGQSAINAIIRMAIPGGKELLDAMTLLHQMQYGRWPPDQKLQAILDLLRTGQGKMAEAILRDGLTKEKQEGGDAFQSTGAGVAPAPTAPPCADAENMSSDKKNLIARLGTMPDTALAAEHGVSHTAIAKLRRKYGIKPYTAKARVDWGQWDAQIRNEAMTAEGLASLIGCGASTIRERRRYLRGEGGKYRPGAPLAEDRVDWAGADWTKSDAELGRLYGVSRQAARKARARYAPQ